MLVRPCAEVSSGLHSIPLNILQDLDLLYHEIYPGPDFDAAELIDSADRTHTSDKCLSVYRTHLVPASGKEVLQKPIAIQNEARAFRHHLD